MARAAAKKKANTTRKPAKAGAASAAAPTKPGQPSSYTKAKADELLALLAKGVPLAHICAREDMPAVRTVSDWRKAHAEFDERFAQARDDGFDFLAADTLAIIDTEPERQATEMGSKVDTGHVAWLKNRVEQRMKLLAKWDSKRYGDRVNVDHSGAIQQQSDEQLDARIAELMAKAASE